MRFSTATRPVKGTEDKIVMKGLIFHGFHGAFESEAQLGQKFTIDLTLYTSLEKPGRTDLLTDTINYALIYKEVESIVTKDRRQLLEAVAHSVASKLLDDHAALSKVHVCVNKPHVSFRGVLDYVGVEITRERTESVASI